MMELRNLTSFLTVAKTLSFTRAAQALNYSQSTVTAQIQALERELGAPLFERLGKRVGLTESGRRLVRYAEKLVTLEREALAAVPESGEPAGMITIGACEELCSGLLPRTMLRLRSRFPKVQFTIKPGSCIDLKLAVADGTMDVALLADAKVREPELVVEASDAESLAIVAPPGHRLAAKRRVRAVDLAGEPWLVMRVTCETSLDKLFKIIAEAGAAPGPVIEFGGFEAVKRCVAAGLGLTAVMRSAIDHELEQGSLVELAFSMAAFRRHIQLVRHRDRWLSPALTAFLEVAKDEIARTAERSGAQRSA